MKQRIQKVLSDVGLDSRRAIEQLVLDGRITVNGQLVTRLPVMVDPETDQMTIDGDPVRMPKAQEKRPYVYVLMNKPKGVYCTNVAQGEQKRAIDLLPPDFDYRVYPVGRLDADSRGLLLLTDDGDLTQQLTHPRFGVPKTYTATVAGFITPETIAQLQKGVWLADDEGGGGFRTAPANIKIVRKFGQNTVLQITIKEGRNRQIRRMFARVGHKMRDLTRIKLGPIELGTLKPGQSRLLTEKEVARLRKAVQEKEVPPEIVRAKAKEKRSAAAAARRVARPPMRRGRRVTE